LPTLISLESGLSLKDTRYEMRRAQDVFRFAAMEALRDDGQIFALRYLSQRQEPACLHPA
jgi:hypothetical protein